MLDIIFSGFALVVLLPLFVPVIIILRLTGEGEIFYRQERIGLHKQKINLIKFATMLKNSPSLGTGTITIQNDPRVLPFGHFLRKTKINELPQLINVFVGDMSLIGPRPLTEQTFLLYKAKTQSLITKVRPGLSGIGSIIFRGEQEILSDASTSINFYEKHIAPYKGELEEWYVKRKSVFLYLLLIFITMAVVFFPKTQIIWSAFKDIPKPPHTLKDALHYS